MIENSIPTSPELENIFLQLMEYDKKLNMYVFNSKIEELKILRGYQFAHKETALLAVSVYLILGDNFRANTFNKIFQFIVNGLGVKTVWKR